MLGTSSRLRLESAEGIEQRAMIGDIDQRAVVMLAVDLGQLAADLAQQIRGSTGWSLMKARARAIGALDAPDDQFAVDVDPLLVAAAAKAGWPGASAKAAVTTPLSAPVAPGRCRRARPAPGRAHRAESTCRRRSRR